MLNEASIVVRFNSLREVIKAQSLLEGKTIGYSTIKTSILFGSLKCRLDPENPFYELLDLQSTLAVNKKMEELRTREIHILQNVSTLDPTLLRIPAENHEQAEFTHQLDDHLSLDYEDSIGPTLEREQASRKRRVRTTRLRTQELQPGEAGAAEVSEDEREFDRQRFGLATTN